MNYRLVKLGIISFVAILLSGCSAAKMTSSWTQEGYTEKSSKILVIGVTQKQSGRQMFEAAIASKLAARGVSSVASYKYFPNEDLTREGIIAFAKENNIDSVMVTKVIDRQTMNQRVSHVTGGPSRYYPYSRRYNGWYGDYHYSRAQVVSYDTQYSWANLETNLYLLDGEDMVWSALTEVEDSNNLSKEINDLGDKLIKQMVAEGLI